jgi:glucosyl-3-phosphoglycerate phosphatase
VSDAATRRLVLLRHGQTADNAAGIWQGHRDSVLSDLGREQAAGAAGALAAYRPRLVVSSDLQRARDTAEAVAAACGLPVRLDPQLREVDVGQWQGRSTAQVRESHPELLAAMGRGEDIRRGATGETLAELAVRVGAALEDVAAELQPHELAVVVGHGVSGRAGVAALTGLNQMQALQVLGGLRNAHWAVLTETSPGGGAPVTAHWRIEAWNLGAPSPVVL